VLLSSPCKGQWQDSIRDYLSAPHNRLSYRELPAGKEGEVLQLIRPYLRDSSAMVRDRARTLIVELTTRTQDASVRMQGPELLISAFAAQPERQGQILAELRRYRRDDFSNVARDSVRGWVRGAGPWLDQCMMLAGFLGLADLAVTIHARTFSDSPSYLRWAALLSNARIGKAYAVEEILQRVRKLPVNDEVVYKIFPDLLYTRQPECIAYVVDAMKSDARNCSSPNADNDTPMPCAYRIMEQLSGVIEGFPVHVDQYGDVVSGDYPTALKEARTWLRENPAYKIVTDTY